MGHIHRYRTILESQSLLANVLISSGSTPQKENVILSMNGFLGDLDQVKELRVWF